MVIDAHNHLGVEIGFYANSDLPYAQTSEDLLLKTSSTDVSHCVVFPFVSYVRGDLPVVAGSTFLSSSIPYEFSNRHLLSEISVRASDETEEAGKFLPFVIADPSREPGAQVPVLRSLRESQRIFGIKIQPTIIQSPIASLLEEGSCILDLAAEWDVPMLIHSSIHPDDIWSQCSDILKVAESRSDVRFVLAHSCRFHRPSLERVAELPNTWFDCSAHRIHCQLAVKDSPAVAVREERFFSDYRNPAQVLEDMAVAYPEKLIWGSDSPFYSWVSARGEVPEKLISSYAEEWECVASLSAENRRRIACENTLNWMGLDENNI